MLEAVFLFFKGRLPLVGLVFLYHGDGEHDKEKPYAAPQIKKLPYGRGLCLSYEIFDRQNVFILSEAVSEKGAFA